MVVCSWDITTAWISLLINTEVQICPLLGSKNDRQTRAGSKPERQELHFQRLKSEYLRWMLQIYKLHTMLSEGKLPQLLPRISIVFRGWHNLGVRRSFQSSDSSHTACSSLGSGACPQYGETQRVCLKQKKKKKPRQIYSIDPTTTSRCTHMVIQATVPADPYLRQYSSILSSSYCSSGLLWTIRQQQGIS